MPAQLLHWLCAVIHPLARASILPSLSSILSRPPSTSRPRSQPKNFRKQKPSCRQPNSRCLQTTCPPAKQRRFGNLRSSARVSALLRLLHTYQASPLPGQFNGSCTGARRQLWSSDRIYSRCVMSPRSNVSLTASLCPYARVADIS